MLVRTMKIKLLGKNLEDLKKMAASYGFDISKEMVRLAAKRGNAVTFVANMASIPVADESVDYCTHLFAPFNEKEFARVLNSPFRPASVRAASTFRAGS